MQGPTFDPATGEAELPLKIGDVFKSLGDFNAATQRLLVSQHKQGSTAVRGSTGRTIRCLHYLQAKKKHDIMMEKKAAELYGDNTEKVKKFLALNLFNGSNACAFKATCSLIRKRDVYSVSQNSILTHSLCCTIAGAKLKSKELRENPDFYRTVMAHGGKANMKALRTEAEKMGYAAAAAKDVTLYRAQRYIRKRRNDAWNMQWAELPCLFAKLRSKGAYAHIENDNEGTFKYAFLCLPAVYRAIKVAGRPISSTDFGHMKHDLFGGLNAVGMFQLGDGRLIPMWTAIFRDQDESVYMWEQCGIQLVKSGMADVYNGTMHFRDRHKGFEAKLKIKFPAFCAVHILRNVRAARGTEKGFHDHMFWRLQGSESAEEYARHLAAFASVFPNTMKYLEKIEPARWVRYAQLETGAHTFGWRSNNAGEIAQGSWLGTMRAMHPLDFFVNVQIKAYETLNSAATEHKVWCAQQATNPALLNVVPHGIKLYTERLKAAVHCTVQTVIGQQGFVSYRNPSTGDRHPARHVDLASGQCTCLCYQEFLFPCKCAFAVSTEQGVAPHTFAEQHLHSSYHLQDSALNDIVADLKIVSAPTVEELSQRTEESYIIRRSLDEKSGLLYDQITAPPQRSGETHGNNKRRRKEKGKSVSTGRTATRTYAMAQATTAAQRNAARQTCQKCRQAGRTDIEPHKARLCPYSEGLPSPDPENIITVLDED